MRTIYCRIIDGDSISAVDSKKKCIQMIKEREGCSSKEAKELLESNQTDWQEVILY